MAEADFVIVGAGAAGAVLAARLSEDPATSVILLEAGAPDRNPLLGVPLMTGLILRSSYANWGYRTEPEPNLDGRRLSWARGKVLGGSTSINGMVYMRGLPLDYDGWAQRGLKGWSYSDVLPYFKKSERYEGGASEYHGTNGPMTVSHGRLANPLFEVYRQAARQAGHRDARDFASRDYAGVGRFDFTIRNGRRVSTSTAFLGPARSRPNLKIVTGAHATRVVVENGRARAVQARVSGQDTQFVALREVILCGGSINSPQLLMLSGIGPADHLRTLKIPVVADLPGVGENLQDHLLVRVEHRALRDVTIDRLRRVDRAGIALAQALLFGTGPAAGFPLEIGGLYKSDPALDEPDLQSHFMPGLSSASLRLPYFSKVLPQDRGAGFFANVYQMRPQSKGRILLQSADPVAAPRIMPGYLTAEADRQVLRRGVRLLRDIFRQAAFDGWRGEELSPGPAIESDGDLDRWISATADTVYHPTSTCRMGPDNDPMAVLDDRLRVRGVDGLRVVDASSFPSITSGNTAAPTIMLGERAADFIGGKDTSPHDD
jgi:choline dehydrogenase